MHPENVDECSSNLKSLLTEAVVQICLDHLKFVKTLHITGVLTFSIDDKVKLDILFSDLVKHDSASLSDLHVSHSIDNAPVLMSTTKSGAKKGRPRKSRGNQKSSSGKASSKSYCLSDNQLNEQLLKVENDTEPKENKGNSLGVHSADDTGDKTRDLEVVNKTESVDFDDFTKPNFHCSTCNFSTDSGVDYNSHCKLHSSLQLESADIHHKGAATIEPRRSFHQEHSNAKASFSCQSCSRRFITSALLEEHVKSKHTNICTLCSETFVSRSHLTIHRQHKHPNGELTCHRCDRVCPTKGALRKHMLRHRESDRGLLKCNQCDKQFRSGSTLYHHKRAIHSEHKPYHCKTCNIGFNFNNSMKLHMLRHGGQRPHRCSICAKAYFTASHLKHHIRAVHEEAKPFHCTFCPKMFPYEHSLKLHLMLHTGERPFTCSFCGKSFVSRSALRAHEESHSDTASPYTCDICHKTYRTAGLLRAHRKRHTTDSERFICHECGHRFMYKSSLEAHYAVHGEARTHECNRCDKKFKTYASLYSHLQIHISANVFVCTKCGKSFKTKERLKAHERRHLGQKPFTCQICNHSFPDKGGLTKHAKTVHATRPQFACPACDKTCSRADNLRVHMRVHRNADLLKLSVKELAVTNSSEHSARSEKSVVYDTSKSPSLAGQNDVAMQNDQPRHQVPFVVHRTMAETAADSSMNSCPGLPLGHNSGLYGCVFPHNVQCDIGDDLHDTFSGGRQPFATIATFDRVDKF